MSLVSNDLMLKTPTSFIEDNVVNNNSEQINSIAENYEVNNVPLPISLNNIEEVKTILEDYTWALGRIKTSFATNSFYYLINEEEKVFDLSLLTKIKQEGDYKKIMTRGIDNFTGMLEKVFSLGDSQAAGLATGGATITDTSSTTESAAKKTVREIGVFCQDDPMPADIDNCIEFAPFVEKVIRYQAGQEIAGGYLNVNNDDEDDLIFSLGRNLYVKTDNNKKIDQQENYEEHLNKKSERVTLLTCWNDNPGYSNIEND